MKTVVELTSLIEKLHGAEDPRYITLVSTLCLDDGDHYKRDPTYFVSDRVYSNESLMELLDEMIKLELITVEQKDEYVAFQQEGAVEIQRLEGVVYAAVQELSAAAEKYGQLTRHGRFTYYPGGHPALPRYIREYQDGGDWLSSSDMC